MEDDPNPYCTAEPIDFESLESTLVGDWECMLSYVEFDTDAGMHVAYRLFDDGQFWAFPVSNGCEAERDCFLSGGAKLCEDARKGTWSVDEDNGALTLDGSVWSARTGRATHTFERGAAQLMFYAADCEHECIAEPQ